MSFDATSPLPNTDTIGRPVPLTYASPAMTGERRPASATFLSILAIILAVIQIVWAAGVLSVSYTLVVGNREAAAAARSTKFMQTSIYAPNGLPTAERLSVVADWTAAASLSRARSEVLSALMAERGMDIAPSLGNGEITLARAKALLTWSGTTASGATYLNLTTGRIELSDERATFKPLGATVELYLDFSHGKFRPGQVGFDPAAGMLAGANAGPRGSTAARSLGKSQAGAAVLALLIIPAAGSLLLSILLFVAAVYTLRRRRVARNMFRWWAMSKSPIAILGACGFGAAMMIFTRDGGIRRGQASDPMIIEFLGILLGVTQGLLSLGSILLVFWLIRRVRLRAWFETQA